MPSKGIMMFAHNNEQIDYFRLAIVNSFLIQKHLGLTAEQITIVTDPNSYNYGVKQLGKREVNKACKNIIQVAKDPEFKHSNIRVYKDTGFKMRDLPFYNINRADAYDLSPYDETILIDADYLIFSNALNQCWGHKNDLMMNWKYQDIMFGRKWRLERVAPMGITMYWATVVYFRKTPYAESLFDLVKHVREEREFFGDLYRFPNKLFRNDFAFSVAAHMLGGFKDKQIEQLPVTLYKTFDHDDIERVNTDGSLILYLEKPDAPGDFVLCKWDKVDLHVMNKWAINRISEGLLEYAKGKTTRVPNKKVGQPKSTKGSNRKRSNRTSVGV